jgi:hypothetical protein
VYKRQEYGQPAASRGLYTRRTDEFYRWIACCGRDGELEGPEVVAGAWTFMALVYDQENQAFRWVVDDRIYASPADMSGGGDFLRIGPFDGVLDDLTLVPRVLTLNEISALYGKPVTRDTASYAIEKRGNYKAERERERINRVKLQTAYVVADDKFALLDSAGGHNVIAVLSKDDTFRVIRLTHNYGFLDAGAGKTGYASVGNILEKAYPAGTSYLAHEAGVIFRSLFNFTLLRSWIIALISAGILFFAIRKYDGIDRIINRIGQRDPLAEGGDKADGGAAGNFLKKIFPLKKYRWWPLGIGALFSILMLIALVWNSREAEWYLNEGFRVVPAGLTRPVHWFLYFSFVAIALLYILMIVESFVVVGPWLALFRVVVLTLLIFLAIHATFFLSLALVVVLILRVVLAVVSWGSRSEYRCPHCYRSFRASPGTEGTCPHCGGGVST